MWRGRDVERQAAARERLAGLYDACSERAYGYALGLLCDAAEAEDIVQEAFAKVFEKTQNGWWPDEPEGYLLRTVRNVAYSRLRRRKVRLGARQHLEGRNAAVLVGRDESHSFVDRESLEVALKALPAKQREVVVMKAFQEMTFEEIGGILKVSRSTAASRYRYALEKLRALLGEGRGL